MRRKRQWALRAAVGVASVAREASGAGAPVRRGRCMETTTTVSPGGLQCLLLSAPIVVAVVTNAYGTTQVVTWLFKTNSGSKRANQE